MNIRDYHGKVEKCNTCTNSETGKPMGCARCFSRGYVAECLNCLGTGQVEEAVAGAGKGMMKSTCSVCGGKKCFAVNKPADWDILHPPVVEKEEEAQTVA